MKVSDLSSEIAAKIEQRQYDQIINKHEGPETWDSLAYYEFISCNSHAVLLPIDKEHHANVTIRRVILGEDHQSLIVFLEDTTYEQGIFAGRVAICDKFEAQSFFVAILYHECFMIEN